MKINWKRLKRESIEAFAEEHNLTIAVTERTPLPGPNKYYASFDHVEVGGDGMLRGVYGDGATGEEAIANYAKQISGELLVFNAYGDNRKEITAPIFVNYP